MSETTMLILVEKEGIAQINTMWEIDRGVKQEILRTLEEHGLIRQQIYLRDVNISKSNINGGRASKNYPEKTEQTMSEFEGITAYDNGGITADRYTIVFPTGDIYCMSRDADKPNGICMYAGENKNIPVDNIDEKINVEDLPEGVRRQIKYLSSHLKEEVIP